MDNAMVRYRYASRRPFAARRRRKAPQQSNRLRRLIIHQSIVCIVLLFIIMVVKNINITATNFITSQVGYVLQHDIEFKNILSDTESFLAGIRNRIAPDQSSGALPGQEGDHASDVIREVISGPDVASVNIGDTENVNMTLDDDTLLNTDICETGAFPKTSVLSANSENSAVSMTDMIKPVEGTLATPFGEVEDAALGSTRMHRGIDIDTNPGSHIKAALDGEITRTGLSPEYGGYVEIQHYNGLRTIYANCGEIDVKVGAVVKKGDIIARTSNGGFLAGSHLHFEVWDGEYAMDPLEYISVPAK